MANALVCDVCGKTSESFTNNTTKEAEVNKVKLNIFAKISTTVGVKDICTSCFDAAISSLCVAVVGSDEKALLSLADKFKEVEAKK